MVRPVVVVVAVLWLMAVCDVEGSSRRITMKDNGYRGIVLALAPDVPTDNLQTLVRWIETLFRNASSYLFEATGKRAFFEQVTILLPSSTDTKGLVNVTTATYERFADADIFVRFFPSTGSGGGPFTLQFGGCGEPGKHIDIPLDFLNGADISDIYGAKHKALVHEWAHFRYGVFDEYGFPDDPRYPPLYAVPGDQTRTPRPTACTNNELRYDITPSAGTCSLDPNTGTPPKGCSIIAKMDDTLNEAIESSIMYQQALKNVAYFCDDTEKMHRVDIPTKQNAICRERSTWDVIRSVDFSDRSPNQAPIRRDFIPTGFRYVIERHPRIVLTLDNEISTKDYYYNHQGSLWSKLVMSLPSGSRVNLVWYNVDQQYWALGKKRLEELTDSESQRRKIVENGLLDFPQGSKPSNMSSAIEEAAKPLQDGEGGILIVQKREFADLTPELVDHLTGYGIRLYVIIYPGQCTASTDPLSELVERTYGRVYCIRDYRLAVSLVSLFDAFDDAVKGYSWESSVRTIQLERRVVEDADANFSFEVDNSVNGSELSVELIGGNRVPLVDSSSFRLHSPQNRIFTFEDRVMVRDKQSFTVRITIPPDATHAGTWTLSAKMRDVPSGVNDSFVRSVKVKSHAAANAIAVDCWTNSESQIVGIPLLVYVSVRRGMNPIRDAKVTVRIFGSEEQQVGEPLLLVDDGLGDPDITRWDGIYSSYVPKLSPSGGYHRIEVTVQGDHGTQVIYDRHAGSRSLPVTPGYKACCGSFVQADVTDFTGAFVRKLVYGPMYVKPFDADESTLAPSRILDLRVERVDDGKGKVTLRWTAPGGNGNVGQADKYEIKFSTDRTDLRENFDRLQTIVVTWFMEGNTEYSRPEPYGSPEERVLNLNGMTNATGDSPHIFFALRAIANGISGVASNIVQVDIRSMPWMRSTPPVSGTPTPSVNGTTAVPSSRSREQDERLKLGLAIGLPVAILVALFIVVLVCLWFQRKRRKEKPRDAEVAKSPVDSLDKKGQDEAANVTAMSPVQSWPAHVLLEHYDRVQEAKQKNVTPPIMTEEDVKDVVPSKYISTSNPLYGEATWPASAPSETSSISSSINNASLRPPAPPPPLNFRRNVTAV